MQPSVPQIINWRLSGHDWAVDLLARQIGRGETRHAYLITGPQGTGRRTLATRLAQALLCPSPLAPGQPCLTCRTCQRVEAGQHPDLAIVQAEGNSLGIEQVRDLQRSLALAPYEGARRVALLLRFEEATRSAANALLKTLEEPPASVTVIVTAESPEALLPTIVSRCEVLRLRALPLNECAAALTQHWQVPGQQAILLAHLSGGRLGAAVRLHESGLEQRLGYLDELFELLPVSLGRRFRLAEQLTKSRDGNAALRQRLQTWHSLWRDVLLFASRSSAPLANLDMQPRIEQIAGQLSLSGIHHAIQSVEGATTALEQNANPRLTLEVLLLDLPRLQFAAGG